MNTFHSDGEALQALNDVKQNWAMREDAAIYLGSHPTPVNLERLVEALEDDSFGVRWTAGVALASAGDAALEPLLRALSQRSSAWLREGAHHIFYYSANEHVSQQTTDLLKAMRGPASDVATMSLAGKLLRQVKH
ncbi:MAG: HEAT repeat domain-containing protein [Caldilineaceae bacterium]